MIWPAYAHESIEENEEHTSGGALLPFPRTVTITKLGGRVKQLIRCMSENALEEKKKGGDEKSWNRIQSGTPQSLSGSCFRCSSWRPSSAGWCPIRLLGECGRT